MKTHKAVQSRFKVTGKGKLKRRKQGLRHLLTKKSSKRKRRLTTPGLVAKAKTRTYKKMMGIG